jgi:hypothetical protein
MFHGSAMHVRTEVIPFTCLLEPMQDPKFVAVDL